MNFNESQKKQISGWVNSGATLSEIQTNISEKFGVSMTYMDVRFLVDDLNLELKDSTPPQAPASADASAEGGVNTSAAGGVTRNEIPLAPQPHPGQTPRGGNPHPFADEDEVPAGTPASDAATAELSKVSVTVDPVQIPGVIVGGSVRFTDGTRGKWLVDQSGQLGLDGLPKDYRPTQDDIVQFRVALKAELQKLGYQ